MTKINLNLSNFYPDEFFINLHAEYTNSNLLKNTNVDDNSFSEVVHILKYLIDKHAPLKKVT